MESHPLSGANAKEGACTRCDSAGRVWPLEQPADIVMELDWGYAWLCLDCWRDLGHEFVAESESGNERSVDTDTGRNGGGSGE